MKLIGLIGRARSGKDTVGKYLHDTHDYLTASFAQPLKGMLTIGFPEVNFFDGDREAVIPWLGKSPRQLMQTLGTEWGRQLVHPDLWVLLAQQHIMMAREAGWYGMVITDVRFPNEAQMILDQGGQLWRISRDVTEQVNPHISEEFDWDAFPHAVIDNNGSLDLLYHQVEELLHGRDFRDLMNQVREFSGEQNPTLCRCDHKLQGTGAVFYQSMGLLQCSGCRGWQRIRKPIK